MDLPAADVAYLKERGLAPTVMVDSGMLCVLFAGFELPPGLEPRTIDLLFRFSPGYPDVPPDMWWIAPAVRRTDGTTIPATEHSEHHLGRVWQRWSRHLQPGQWRPGLDGLQTYLAIFEADLVRHAASAA